MQKYQIALLKKIVLFFILSFSFIKAQENNQRILDDKDMSLENSNKKEGKEQTLDDIIKYDSNIQQHSLAEKKTYLIEEAVVEYKDIKIEAHYIEIHWDTHHIEAKGLYDESGKLTKPAIFYQTKGKEKDKKDKFEYDHFTFNFKTKKGISYNIRTEEPKGGIIMASRVKKNEEGISLMRDVRYTTDTYYKEGKDPDPDFFIKADKAKYIEKKSAITGPLWVYIYKSPFPIPLPFAYLPLENKNSGIHVPNIQEFYSQGLSLQGLGFYWLLSEYFDSNTKTDLYLNGSFNFSQVFRYKKRYKYDSSASFNYRKEIQGIKGLKKNGSPYKKNTRYKIELKYNQDNRFIPSLNISAHINYNSGTSNFDRLNPDITFKENSNFIKGQAHSQITLVKKFETFPLNSITFRFAMDQNFAKKENNFVFPTISTSYNINPFSSKKNDLLKQAQINYNFRFENKANGVKNEETFQKELLEKLRTGARQTLSLSTSISLPRDVSLSPKIDYKENWVLQTIEKTNDPNKKEGKDKKINGFKSFRTFDFNMELTGTLTALKKIEKGKLLALRHQIKPSISFFYEPNFSTPFWGYYKTYNNTKYNPFQKSLYQDISTHAIKKIKINIGNNLEAKIKDDQAPKKERKIKIFETLDINTSYNFQKEEKFKWDPIQINGATILVKESRLTYSFTLDPYKVGLNKKGELEKINQLGNLRLNQMTFGFNFKLNKELFSKKEKKTYTRQGKIRYDKFFFDENNYAQYDMPWNLDFDLNYNHSKNLDNKITHSGSLNFKGSISPSPYWEIDLNGNYNFSEKAITQLGIDLKRDIRSFVMKFTWNPIATGPIRTWGFNIGFKPSSLSNIQLNRRNKIEDN